MEIARRILQLFIISPTYDLKAWLRFLSSLFVSTNSTPVTIYSSEEVLEKIASGKSIIRFGDGEIMIVTGRDIYFQRTSRKLAKMMSQIIEHYSERSPYIVGVPHEKISAIALDEKQHRLWRWYRIYFPLRFRTAEKYTSLVLFYHQRYFKESIAPLFKSHHVVWVANELAITGVKTYAESVGARSSFIQIPKTDSFDEYERIKNETIETVRSIPLPTVVLCSGGPATKILLYELAQLGIQGLDIGHGMNVIIEDKDRTWTY